MKSIIHEGECYIIDDSPSVSKGFAKAVLARFDNLDRKEVVEYIKQFCLQTGSKESEIMPLLESKLGYSFGNGENLKDTINYAIDANSHLNLGIEDKIQQAENERTDIFLTAIEARGTQDNIGSISMQNDGSFFRSLMNVLSATAQQRAEIGAELIDAANQSFQAQEE